MKKLGINQRIVLEHLKNSGGIWSDRCSSWYFGSIANTCRILHSLTLRGLVRQTYSKQAGTWFHLIKEAVK